MPQQTLNYRRLTAAHRDRLGIPGYETTARQPYGRSAGAEMLARHQHLTGQRAAETRQQQPGDDQATALRRRQLALLRLSI
jgi:hypothetical protein